MNNPLAREYSSGWVGCLSKDDQSNWNICKQSFKWGSPNATAQNVKNGDDLFIWKSGSGYLAWCKATSDARPAGIDTPWSGDGRNYLYVFDIRVIEELSNPWNPGSHRFTPGSNDFRQNITELPNVRLSQFPELSEEQTQQVKSFFGIRNLPPGIQDEIREEEADTEEERLRSRTDISRTEVLRLVKTRRGQGDFRQNVMKIEKFCRVTGLSNFDYLRASHIKPWAQSDDREKLDGNNGLMLAPHVDMLFDGGWIQFSDEGHMVTSPQLDSNIVPLWHLEQVGSPKPFNPLQVVYLEYHRSVIYKT